MTDTSHEALRAALKPFADAVARRPWLESRLVFEIGGSRITNRDLRRAAEAYAALEALTKEMDEALAEIEESHKMLEPSFDAGFHLGASQMREKAAQYFVDYYPGDDWISEAIRALPMVGINPQKENLT